MKCLAYIYAVLASLLMLGCSTPPEPFEVQRQVLHTKTAQTGEQLFVFIVTVAPSPKMQLNTQRQMTRSELKRFAKEQRIEDSPQLKLALEERAITLLAVELKKKSYCSKGYKIEQVYWQERKVQLRGQCDE